jgi:SAM-dependent methyltransferase
VTSMEWGAPAEFPAVYEELMVPGFFTEFADDLLERAQPRDGERMLDVATGTGIVPRRARERVPGLQRLVGIDLTPAMLAIAREKGDGIEFLEGNAQELPFEDGSFDLVTCQQGLQFFPERERALAEFRRVLTPGGRVLVACWYGIEEQLGYHPVAEAIAEHFPEAGPAALAPWSFGGGDKLAGLLSDAGFQDVEVTRAEGSARFATGQDLARSFIDGSPVSLALADAPQDRRDALLRDAGDRVRERCGEPVEAAMATHLARGRA